MSAGRRVILGVGILISAVFANTVFAASTAIKDGQVVKQNGYEVTIKSAPKWVEPMALPDTLSSSQAGNVHYHLYDQQGYAGNTPQRYYRIVKEANNVSGLESASQLNISFSPLYQQLHLHGATVYRGGKPVYQLHKKDIKLFSNEDELDKQLLSGRASALLLLPSTQVGDVIDFEYSLIGANPVFGNRFSISFDLGWSVPLDIAQARIVIPNDKQVNYKTMGANLTPVESKSPFGKTYTWRLTNPSPIYDEEQYPYGYDRYPYVAVSEYKNWQEVVSQQLPFYQDRTLPHDLKKQVNAMLKGLNKEEQAIKALQFVQQQIRYLGLEYGINAFKPHLPKEVWKNRRGDCKDKTLLLIAILEHVGIAASPALVNTAYREGMRNVIPASNRFDHVITHIEIDGKSYFVDPTKRPQYGSLETIGYHSFDQALILKAGETALTEMPKDQISNHYTDVVEEFTISDYTAPVKLKIVSKYSGRGAERVKSRFDDDHIQKIEQEYRQYYEKIYGEIISSKPVVVEFDESNTRLTVTEEYIVNNFFELNENRVQFSVSALSVKDQLHVPKVQSRESPFYLGRPKWVTHQTKIHFPLEELSAKPEIPHVIENDYFRFKYDDIILPNTYVLNYEFEIKDWVVRHEDTRAVIKQMDEIRDIGYQTFNFTPDSAFVDQLVGDLMRSTTSSSSGVANGGLQER